MEGLLSESGIPGLDGMLHGERVLTATSHLLELLRPCLLDLDVAAEVWKWLSAVLHVHRLLQFTGDPHADLPPTCLLQAEMQSALRHFNLQTYAVLLCTATFVGAFATQTRH